MNNTAQDFSIRIFKKKSQSSHYSQFQQFNEKVPLRANAQAIQKNEKSDPPSEQINDIMNSYTSIQDSLGEKQSQATQRKLDAFPNNLTAKSQLSFERVQKKVVPSQSQLNIYANAINIPRLLQTRQFSQRQRTFQMFMKDSHNENESMEELMMSKKQENSYMSNKLKQNQGTQQRDKGVILMKDLWSKKYHDQITKASKVDVDSKYFEESTRKLETIQQMIHRLDSHCMNQFFKKDKEHETFYQQVSQNSFLKISDIQEQRKSSQNSQRQLESQQFYNKGSYMQTTQYNSANNGKGIMQNTQGRRQDTLKVGHEGKSLLNFNSLRRQSSSSSADHNEEDDDDDSDISEKKKRISIYKQLQSSVKQTQEITTYRSHNNLKKIISSLTAKQDEKKSLIRGWDQEQNSQLSQGRHFRTAQAATAYAPRSQRQSLHSVQSTEIHSLAESMLVFKNGRSASNGSLLTECEKSTTKIPCEILNISVRNNAFRMTKKRADDNLKESVKRSVDDLIKECDKYKFQSKEVKDVIVKAQSFDKEVKIQEKNNRRQQEILKKLEKMIDKKQKEKEDPRQVFCKKKRIVKQYIVD